MCGEYEPQRANFWAPKYVKILVFGHFLKNFPLVCISPGVHVNLSYFQRCIECWPQRPNFGVFRHFLKYFPLAAHHSCFTCFLGVLLYVFQWCAPKALFLGRELRLQQSLLGRQASCFVCMLSQWEMTLHCNIICYWLAHTQNDPWLQNLNTM